MTAIQASHLDSSYSSILSCNHSLVVYRRNNPYNFLKVGESIMGEAYCGKLKKRTKIVRATAGANQQKESNTYARERSTIYFSYDRLTYLLYTAESTDLLP